MLNRGSDNLLVVVECARSSIQGKAFSLFVGHSPS